MQQEEADLRFFGENNLLKIPFQALVEQLPVDDPDTEVDQGCLLYKLGEHDKACAKFTGAMQVLGYQPGQ